MRRWPIADYNNGHHVESESDQAMQTQDPRPMIDTDLLRAKGTIEALYTLNHWNDHPADISILSDRMDVSKGTARDRLADLIDAGLVEEDADLVDGSPQRVFMLTDNGTQVAEQIEQILSSDTTDDTTETDE